MLKGGIKRSGVVFLQKNDVLAIPKEGGGHKKFSPKRGGGGNKFYPVLSN